MIAQSWWTNQLSERLHPLVGIITIINIEVWRAPQRMEVEKHLFRIAERSHKAEAA